MDLASIHSVQVLNTIQNVLSMAFSGSRSEPLIDSSIMKRYHYPPDIFNEKNRKRDSLLEAGTALGYTPKQLKLNLKFDI
jgi:hypothetical protein